MTPPKRIYLELNNVPPCNFGALWFDAEVHTPAGENCAAYVLESEAQKELAEKDATIRYLDNRLAEIEKAR